MSTATELAQFCVPEQPVTLIYIRAGGDRDLLRRRVIELAARRGSDVELVEIGPDEAPPDLVCTTGSLLLVMRAGELYGQAAGPLPLRELSRMIDKALERHPG